MFVAEAKYRAEAGVYDGRIAAADGAGLMALLTFEEQEARVVERVRRKAETFGQDLDEAGRVRGGRYKVAPAMVAALYKDWVMPLTKRVQVEYLLRRHD
jgi:chorismate mutase